MECRVFFTDGTHATITCDFWEIDKNSVNFCHTYGEKKRTSAMFTLTSIKGVVGGEGVPEIDDFFTLSHTMHAHG